jgi:hypothetical protein
MEFLFVCFLVLRIPDEDKVQKRIDSECYTPSSESLRFKLYSGFVQ